MHAIPPLAKPFAAFGAAAGLFAVLGLGASREAARLVSPLVPMLLTAVVAAGAGETLRRWPRLHEPALPREVVVLWVAVIAAAAGALSGALVALVTWGPGGMPRFTLGGAAVGLAFTPSCLVIFDAAKRAARARLGSLVAATDHRTVLSTVAAGIAFASAVQVPALLSANASLTLTPRIQLGLSFLVAAGALAMILRLQRQDRASRAILDQQARDEATLESAASEEPATTGLDLGLGGETWSRLSDVHYRASGRPDVVLRGSIREAVTAFEDCARQRHRSLIVATCGLTAVVVSAAIRLGVLL